MDVFGIEPLGDERTRLTISLHTQTTGAEGGPPDPDEAPARIQQVERLAHWLAEHGGGRVLESGWGKP